MRVEIMKAKIIDTSKSLHIRLLSRDDAASLLQFEFDNRAWFETQIEARPAAFYSLEGVQRHISALLVDYAAGKFHPCLLVNAESEILGRANLKDINQEEGSAEVGYRIAYQHQGKGYASAALLHLIATARFEWHLQRLHAYVLDGNPASSRVLQKAGFIADQVIPNLARVNQRDLDGKRYTLDLVG